MLGQWKSHVKKKSDLAERSLHPAHFSHVDCQNRSCPRKGKLTWVWLLQWLPRYKHHTDPPAMLRKNVAEVGEPGGEPAVSAGGALRYGGGAPCSCITMTSSTLSQVRQV